jgi:hypothetical protein
MLFLRLGIRCWMGACTRHCRQQACMLGESQDPTRTKHAARGRGACPASAIASGNSAAHVGTHRKHQGRWEFGEHEPFGEVCGVGGCPCSTPVSSWSLRPPAPAAAWSKTVKIILQQDRGGRTVNGLWRPQQQASCTRPPRRKTRPTQTSSIALSAPSRHTQDRHAQKTPRGLGGMGNFFT